MGAARRVLRFSIPGSVLLLLTAVIGVLSRLAQNESLQVATDARMTLAVLLLSLRVVIVATATSLSDACH
jgi:hypothetical protein